MGKKKQKIKLTILTSKLGHSVKASFWIQLCWKQLVKRGMN